MMQSIIPDAVRHEVVHRRSGIVTRKMEFMTVPVQQRTTPLRCVLRRAPDTQGS